DRVRDLGGLDQALLGHLRAEVAAHEEALGADDRQCDVVGDAGGRFGSEEVPSRSLEELQHRLVLPRGRVRYVHDDPCACERFGQPLTGNGVDAGGGGSRHNFVTALAEELHELLPDEPAAADHDDLHDRPPRLSPRIGAVDRPPPPTSGTACPGCWSWTRTGPRPRCPGTRPSPAAPPGVNATPGSPSTVAACITQSLRSCWRRRPGTGVTSSAPG